MKSKTILIAIATMLALPLSAFAAEESTNTDLGTLDKNKAAEAFKKQVTVSDAEIAAIPDPKISAPSVPSSAAMVASTLVNPGFPYRV